MRPEINLLGYSLYFKEEKRLIMSGDGKAEDRRERLVSFYSKRVDNLTALIGLLKNKGRLLAGAALASFILAVVCFTLFCFHTDRAWLMVAAALLLVLYIGVRRMDISNGAKADRLKALRAAYMAEQQYMQRQYGGFSPGTQYINPSHAYSLDMDIFGRDGLYQRVCRTVTRGGSRMLADWLTAATFSRDDAHAKAGATRELAHMEPFRAAFMAQAYSMNRDHRRQEADTQAVLDAINALRAMPLKGWMAGGLARLCRVLSLSVMALLVALAVAGVVPASLASIWVVGQMFVSIALSAGCMRRMMRCTANVSRQVAPYMNIIRMIGQERFTSPVLTGSQRLLGQGQGGAMAAFAELDDIISSMDRRANMLGLVIFNALFFSDCLIVRRFLRWRASFVDEAPVWIDAVSRVDALVSMATFRHNEPQTTDADILDGEGVVYRAEALVHPFLGERAVANDFNIDPQNYYIITGANMAGKSTFLRALGVNYVLAMNGMPVFARRLEVTVFSLFSNMRTTDDLTRGISYFNAELLRLKQLLAYCREHDNTLVILDEILKGTNSLDKLNGSRLFLKAVAAMPVTGVIATHDLELSKMEQEMHPRFHNYCFEIQLSQSVNYSYKITPGVARNQNATYLLKEIL